MRFIPVPYTPYNPNGSNQPYARALAQVMENAKRMNHSYYRENSLPNLDANAQTFLKEWLAYNMPDIAHKIENKKFNTAEIVKKLRNTS